MNIILLGAAGFIGTNLTIRLAENNDNVITVVDKDISFFTTIRKKNFKNVIIKESTFDLETNFDALLQNQDVLYHLVSTTVPTTSNQHIPQELMANVVVTSQLLEACVRSKVKKVVFISSGGTVYGNSSQCPLKETMPTDPISSYGVQKITIEKILNLYYYMYNLDYRIVRLANPYGPYQRPNGVLGAATTFTYKALRGEEITVYGDGSIIRDFIYIDDAVRGILNIVEGERAYKVYNLGCGYGTSLRQLLDVIHRALNIDLNITYKKGRQVDVPINYLDISRYESDYGRLNPVTLEEGIRHTADFMEKNYLIK